MIEQRAVPVIAAPMAGGISTPELVAAVGAAGGFGFLAAGYLTEEALSGQIARVRELTGEPFGVNLFVPGRRRNVELADYRDRVAAEAERYGVTPGAPHWDDDLYQAKIELLIGERVPVVSFTFGCPEKSTVERLRAVGTQVIASVTGPAEARQAAESGVDALCVQGSEAGGHRALFEDDPDDPAGGELIGLLGALRSVAGEVDLPLIAAGGIVRGGDVAAVLSAGAVAAQCGTAFLVSDEAGTAPAQRAELAAGDRPTAITRAFSGRPARGLVNRFMREHGPHAPAAYPQLNNLTKPVRGAAGKAADPEAMSLWAGQTYARAEPKPAAELVRELAEEAHRSLDAARTRLG